MNGHRPSPLPLSVVLEHDTLSPEDESSWKLATKGFELLFESPAASQSSMTQPGMTQQSLGKAEKTIKGNYNCLITAVNKGCY